MSRHRLPAYMAGPTWNALQETGANPGDPLAVLTLLAMRVAARLERREAEELLGAFSTAASYPVPGHQLVVLALALPHEAEDDEVGHDLVDAVRRVLVERRRVQRFGR